MKAIKIVIFLMVSLLLIGSAVAWKGTPTERSRIMIRNNKSNVIIYRVEWQNHVVNRISPFESWFVAGGEVQPGKEMSIPFDGYPVGAILRLTMDEKDENHRYKPFYNKAYVLKDLVNIFYIYLGPETIEELQKEKPKL